MVLGGGTPGKQLSHEGGALVNEISALTKEAQEAPPSSHHARSQWERQPFGSEPSANTDSLSTMTLDTPASRPWEIDVGALWNT